MKFFLIISVIAIMSTTLLTGCEIFDFDEGETTGGFNPNRPSVSKR